jgi:hypothetical protein
LLRLSLASRVGPRGGGASVAAWDDLFYGEAAATRDGYLTTILPDAAIAKGPRE